MHYRTSIVLWSSLASIISATPNPQGLEALPVVLNDQYVVVLNNGVNLTSHLSWVSTQTSSNERRNLNTSYGVKTTYNIANTFVGYAGTFDEDEVNRIRQSQDVSIVENDIFWTTNILTRQNNAPWSLGRISNRARGSNTYFYDNSSGINTYAYVVDTGVNVDHVEFEGRASKGYNAAGGEFSDTAGHGTHVAGIIGSRSYGVAKLTNIIDVKVFGPGEATSLSVVLDGYQWAVNNIITNGRQRRAVINLSMGGDSSTAFNRAIQVAYQNNVTSVVAAGNENADASNYSPASAPEAITVGASDENDARASFSNFGSVLDFFAPGTNILSTFIGSSTATRVLTGTSMSSPHVAGLALFLQAAESGYGPVDLLQRLRELASHNAVSNSNGSPSELVYNGSGR